MGLDFPEFVHAEKNGSGQIPHFSGESRNTRGGVVVMPALRKRGLRTDPFHLYIWDTADKRNLDKEAIQNGSEGKNQSKTEELRSRSD